MEHIFNRNENANNEIATKIFIGLAALIAAIWLLCWIGIFDFDMEAATLFLSISLAVLIIPVMLIYVFHIHGKYMKYILISILALIMGLSYCIFTFQMVILFLTPSLVSTLYMNKRLLYFSGVVSLLVVVGSHVITGFYVLQPWLEPFMGVENIIRFGVIPRIMQLGLCFSLCLSIGTVKNYVSSIYDKIGTKERTYLILKYGRFAADYDQSNKTL